MSPTWINVVIVAAIVVSVVLNVLAMAMRQSQFADIITVRTRRNCVCPWCSAEWHFNVAPCVCNSRLRYLRSCKASR